jgi:hypothetical protein
VAIQVILITSFVGFLFYFVGHARSTRMRASSKVFLLLFVVAGVVAILDPAALTRVAHWVGVGRGTDLLLYATVVAFVFVTLVVYLRLKDYEKRLVKLARHIALAESSLQYQAGAPGGAPAWPHDGAVGE